MYDFFCLSLEKFNTRFFQGNCNLHIFFFQHQLVRWRQKIFHDSQFAHRFISILDFALHKFSSLILIKAYSTSLTVMPEALNRVSSVLTRIPQSPSRRMRKFTTFVVMYYKGTRPPFLLCKKIDLPL